MPPRRPRLPRGPQAACISAFLAPHSPLQAPARVQALHRVQVCAPALALAAKLRNKDWPTGWHQASISSNTQACQLADSKGFRCVWCCTRASAGNLRLPGRRQLAVDGGPRCVARR